MTKKELMAKLKAVEPENKDQRNTIVCSLIGHSRIQTVCMGYWHCGRCGELLGDTIGGVYRGATKAVVVGHDCPTCRDNYQECTWKDKLYVPDPFKQEAA